MDATPQHAIVHVSTGVPSAQRVVFVVDDEPVIAHTLAVILKQAGFAALPFDHPDKAIAAAESSTPDLLITDVMMAGMTAIELAIHFSESTPRMQGASFLWTSGNSRPIG